MKKIIIKNIMLFMVACISYSCGHPTIKTKEEAVKFLESHKFYDESAHVYGQGGGPGLKTGFEIIFSGGNALINEETIPYTIEELNRSGKFSGSGFHIKFCGSQRYAYGGCIDCYLSGGMNDDGSKSKTGPSIQVEGSYVKAFFSYTGNGITNK